MSADEQGTRPHRGVQVFIALVVLVSLLTSIGVFHVWYHYQLVHLGFELGREINRQQRLLEENRKLNLELATRKRTGRLEQIAEQLGLRPCEASDIVTIKLAEESQ